MLAYQMIYTACGKDRSGAFSVWAKSNEITKTECDEIYKLMSYRKPKNVPYEPTEEELETLFPKKYAYFTLSSGRYCFAKCTYRHKVYSDVDPRSGNFIIHAFVTDKIDGVNPFAIFNSTAFKTLLTYKEWHDDPVPDNLPAVELDLKPSYNDAIISKYIKDSSKSGVIASLAQSVINSIGDEEKKVTFNATDKEEQEIYSLLGIILPPSVFKETTFANQYAPSVEFALSSTGMKLVKIRNIFESALPAAFNYEMERDGGSFVFNFTNNIFASVDAGRYVSDVINTLKTSNLFNALKLVEQVDKISTAVKCDYDTATRIYHIVNNDLTWFNGAEEFISALQTAERNGYVKEKDYATKIYNDIIKTKRWGFGSCIDYLVKLVLKYADTSVKDQLIEDCFYNLDKFGVNDSAESKAFVTSIKNNMPFTIGELGESMLRNGKWAQLISSTTSKNVLYLVIESMVQLILSKPTSTDAFGIALKVFRQAISARDLATINLYLNSIKALGVKSENWFVENSASECFVQVNAETMDFAFNIVAMLSDRNEQVKLVQSLVSKNLTSQDLIPSFIKFASSNASVADVIENSLRSNPEFKDFFMKKEAYVFKNTNTVNAKSLDSYFEKFYLAGYDSGVYFAKLKIFIAGLDRRIKFTELLHRYDMIEKLPDTFNDVMQIISYIEQEIYTLPFEDLLKLPADQFNRLAGINKRLTMAGQKSTGRFEMLCTIQLIQGKFGKEKLVEAINTGTLYSSLTHQQMDTFATKYTTEVIELFLTFARNKGVNKRGLLVSIIAPLFTRVTNNKIYFKDALDRLKKGFEEFMAELMAYAFNVEDAFGAQAKSFVIWFVDGMKRGDYKKLFKSVENLIEDGQLAPVKAYMDKHLDENKGFFESLFGKKAQKEPKDQKDKNNK